LERFRKGKRTRGSGGIYGKSVLFLDFEKKESGPEGEERKKRSKNQKQGAHSCGLRGVEKGEKTEWGGSDSDQLISREKKNRTWENAAGVGGQ